MGEAHKWGKLPKWSAGVGHCDEKSVITNISGTVPLSFVNHLDFLLSILPLIGVSLNITNPSWFSFYIPLLIEIFSHSELPLSNSLFLFLLNHKDLVFFGGVIGGHITESSSSSIVCLGVCFEKGNACSGGNSVFQNGTLPYPTLSTFFFPP
jgi:hypothetical protein